MPQSLVILVLLALPGCTRDRWDCEACVRDEPSSCATSVSYGHRTEEEARCHAAEKACVKAGQATFDRVCKDKISIRTGCEPEIYPSFDMTCSSKTELTLPIGGVR